MIYMKKALFLSLLLIAGLRAESSAVVKEAAALYNLGTYEDIRKAIPILEKTVSVNPDDAEAAALLALSYYHIASLEKSDLLKDDGDTLAARALLKGDPKNITILKASAAGKLLDNNFSEAALILEGASVIAPQDAEVWYYLALCHEGSLNDPQTPAGMRAQKSLSLNPGLLWLLEDQFMDALSKKDLETAQAKILEIEKSHPGYRLLPYLNLLVAASQDRKVPLDEIADFPETEHPLAIFVNELIWREREKAKEAGGL